MKIFERINDFWLTNLWWVIALGVIVVIVLFVVLDIFIIRRKNSSSPIPKKKKSIIADKNEYLDALGGEKNVLSHNIIGSRIILKLEDYSLLNKSKIEELGVSGFIVKSDQLTLVVKDNAKKVYETIFSD